MNGVNGVALPIAIRSEPPDQLAGRSDWIDRAPLRNRAGLVMGKSPTLAAGNLGLMTMTMTWSASPPISPLCVSGFK